MTPLRRLTAVLAFATAAAAGTVGPASARADELAPELETLDLRQKAALETKGLVASLEPRDRRRLAGLYLAFDIDSRDPSAMVACDDDGDYVIVITDAMLRLAAAVARAQSYDEANASRNVEEYAEFVARAQVREQRLLPPPPGFLAGQKAGTTQEQRLREGLAFLVARELAHLRAGDLVCSHPTATRESGDDVWTAEERSRAFEQAAAVYGAQADARDREATTRVLALGRSEQGALGLLRFFETLECDLARHATGFVPTYLAQHPAARSRAESVKAAARVAARPIASP